MRSRPFTFASLLLAASFIAGGVTAQRSHPDDPPVIAPEDTTPERAPITHQADPNLEGLSLRQRNHARRQDRIFQQEWTRLQEACGWAPESKIVWRSFADEINRSIDDGLNLGFSYYCARPLTQIRRMCESGNTDAFTATRARISSYRCVYGGPDMGALRMDRSQLVYQVDWDAGNQERFIDDFYGRNF